MTNADAKTNERFPNTYEITNRLGNWDSDDTRHLTKVKTTHAWMDTQFLCSIGHINFFPYLAIDLV